jgi:hypothetical protein
MKWNMLKTTYFTCITQMMHLKIGIHFQCIRKKLLILISDISAISLDEISEIWKNQNGMVLKSTNVITSDSSKRVILPSEQMM